MFKSFYDNKFKSRKISYKFGLSFNTPYGYLPYKFKYNSGFKFLKKGLFSRPVVSRKYPIKFGY